MKMSEEQREQIAKGFAEQVCDGVRTLLQVEHALSRFGMIGNEHNAMIQRIRDKISERKKGHE